MLNLSHRRNDQSINQYSIVQETNVHASKVLGTTQHGTSMEKAASQAYWVLLLTFASKATAASNELKGMRRKLADKPGSVIGQSFL